MESEERDYAGRRLHLFILNKHTFYLVKEIICKCSLYKNEKTLQFLYFVIFKYTPKIIQERIYLKTNQTKDYSSVFGFTWIVFSKTRSGCSNDKETHQLIKCREYELKYSFSFIIFNHLHEKKNQIRPPSLTCLICAFLCYFSVACRPCLDLSICWLSLGDTHTGGLTLRLPSAPWYFCLRLCREPADEMGDHRKTERQFHAL